MLFVIGLSLAASNHVGPSLRKEARAAMPTCTFKLKDAALIGTCPDHEPFSADTTPVQAACSAGAAPCNAARSAFIEDLAYTHGPARPPVLGTVIPVLRDRSYVDGMLSLVERVKADGKDVSARAPVHFAFGADVEVLYMIDAEDQARAVNLGEMEALHLAPEPFHAATTANAVRVVGDVAVVIDGPLEAWRGSYYTSSLLFDLARWSGIAGNGPLLAAVPSNDMILLLHSNAPSDVATLQMRAAIVHASADRPVSSAIFFWTGTGWAPYTGAEAGPMGRADAPRSTLN